MIQLRAEADDAGLLRVFGSAGRGTFPVRAALRTEVLLLIAAVAAVPPTEPPHHLLG